MWSLQTAFLRTYVFFSSSTSFARVYILFFCLFALLMISSGQPQLLWRLWRISAAPVTTTGHVTRLDCSNHGHIDYSFTVDGLSYNVQDTFIHGVANCPALKGGQAIAIYYEKSIPGNSYALYPSDTSGNQARNEFITALSFFGASLLLLPLFLGWLWTIVARWTSRFDGKPW
jgi:hypothetical protein